MKFLKKALDGICTALQALAAVLLMAMVCIIFYHVIMRYFFNQAPRWSEEVSLQLMIWFCFIALLLGVKDKAHIAVELFVSHMPKALQNVIEIFNLIVIAVVGGVMGTSLIPYIKKLSRNKLPATGLPVWIQFAVPTVVGVLVCITALIQLWDFIKENYLNGKGRKKS